MKILVCPSWNQDIIYNVSWCQVYSLFVLNVDSILFIDVLYIMYYLYLCISIILCNNQVTICFVAAFQHKKHFYDLQPFKCNFCRNENSIVIYYC